MDWESLKEREERERDAVRREEARIKKMRAIKARANNEEKIKDISVDDISLPDGLPDTKDLKELAQAVETDIFETYYKLMKHPKTPASVKKACADALADRAKGRAEQAITQTVKNERPDASLEEVARMILFAMRDAKERGAIEAPPIIDVTPTDKKTDNLVDSDK